MTTPKGYGAIWCHGQPARNAEHALGYLRRDDHSRSKVQIMYHGRMVDVMHLRVGASYPVCTKDDYFVLRIFPHPDRGELAFEALNVRPVHVD